MAQRIVDYLRASKVLLQRLREPAACADAQTKAVIAMLDNARDKLDVPELARIQEAVADVSFPSAMETELMEKLGALAAAGVVVATTMKRQDYTGFLELLTKEVWDALKLRVEEPFFEWLCKAGLREPSEPTVQLMSLVIMSAHEGIEQVQALTPSVRTVLLKQVKKTLQSVRKGNAASGHARGKAPRHCAALSRAVPGALREGVRESRARAMQAQSHAAGGGEFFRVDTDAQRPDCLLARRRER